MNSVKHAAALEKKELAPGLVTYVSLDHETRQVVDTATAAFHLNRQPQTLRVWASAQTYPDALRPIRVMGRLGWPVDGIRQLLKAGA